MSRNSKIFVLILVLVLIGVFYIFNLQKSKPILERKISELNDLIIQDRDCAKVISKAADFLKSNPNAEQIWNFLGVCQFDTGKFEEAKISFEKTLSLNPEHEGAKNYLERIANIASKNEINVTSSELPLEKAEFEFRLGLNFDDVLKFEKAVKRPSNIPEFLMATYVSSDNFAKTVTNLKEVLSKTKINFTISEMEEGTILSIGNSDERKIINTQKNSPVKVIVYYQKLN